MLEACKEIIEEFGDGSEEKPKTSMEDTIEKLAKTELNDQKVVSVHFNIPSAPEKN